MQQPLPKNEFFPQRFQQKQTRQWAGKRDLFVGGNQMVETAARLQGRLLSPLSNFDYDCREAGKKKRDNG